MTGLVVLPLHTIFHDRDQLATLHKIQMARQAEREITAGARPKGMRLSIACPVRRVKAAIDEFWLLHLDDGLGERGYLMEDLLEVGLFHGMYAPLVGASYESQVAIQWHEKGRSAFDFVTSDGRVISCKSKDPKDRSIEACKPSSANVAQEKRMLALAGREAGTEFDVWMVDPGTLRACGPHTHTLSAEERDAALTEATSVAEAYAYFTSLPRPTEADEWNDPAAWEQRWNLTHTSTPFKIDTLDACGAIEARVRAERRAAHAATKAKAEADLAKHLIRPHIEEQIALARQDNPATKSVTAYGADKLITYTIDARGALRVTERDDLADAAA